ncbi:MAG: twin-arginine translocase subunit TatC [Bacteroidota bacterium]
MLASATFSRATIYLFYILFVLGRNCADEYKFILVVIKQALLTFAHTYMSILNRVNKPDPNGEMSFVEHLEALRWHLVRSVVVIVVLAILVGSNIHWVMDHVILGPLSKTFPTYTSFCNFSHWAKLGSALCIKPPNVTMQAVEFGSQFFGAINIAMVSGLILGFPYLCWETWRFIKPALTSGAIKISTSIIFWVSFFFFLGLMFGYYVLAPFTFSFLANFKLGTQQIIETKPTLSDYISNMLTLLLGAGLAFELPVISYVVTRIGLVTPQHLKTARKYAFVAILVIAAIITPSPDIMSQMLVTVPLVILYELGIQVSKLAIKQLNRRETAVQNVHD